MTCLLYTHYMAIPVVICLAAYHLFFVPKNSLWLRVVFIFLVSGLLFLPWLQVGWQALGIVSGEGARNFFANSASSLLNNVLTQFSNGNTALLAIFAWYFLRHRNRLMVGTLTVGTFVLIIILNERFQFVSIARYLSAVWPLLALVVGLGAGKMQLEKLHVGVLLGVWFLAGVGLIIPRTLIPEINDPGWQVFLPWQRLASQLEHEVYGDRDDPDLLVNLLPAPTPYWFHAPLASYYLFDLKPFVISMPDWLQITQNDQPQLRVHLVESPEAKTEQAFISEAVPLIDGIDRVWLVHSPTELPSPFARTAWGQTLGETGFIACDPVIADSELQISLFSRIPTDQLTAEFGSSVKLGALKSRVNLAESQISVLLGWQLRDVPPNTLSVGLHIDDPNGTLVAQSDYGIPVSSLACTQNHVSLGNLPAGEYSLKAVVYDWQTGIRLVGGTLDGVSGERLELLRFNLP